MSYATRGSGPASSLNQLQDSGQYFGDKERRQLRSQLPPGKARGKGRRSRLFYLRELRGKAARIKERRD